MPPMLLGGFLLPHIVTKSDIMRFFVHCFRRILSSKNAYVGKCVGNVGSYFKSLNVIISAFNSPAIPFSLFLL